MPTLAFHKVEPGFSYSATNYSPKRFARLLHWLSASDFNPELTFDDAYESFLEHAAPTLAEHGASATIFAPVGWLGRINSWDYSSRLRPSRHLNPSQLRELADSGFAIESHGYKHLDLTALDDRTLERELRDSKFELEQILGSKVTEICYPFGRYNSRVEEAAKEAGYTRGWSLNPRDCGEFTRGRWGVYGYDSLFSIQSKLAGGALSSIEYAKVRLTNQLSRAGKLAFWTESVQESGKESSRESGQD